MPDASSVQRYASESRTALQKCSIRDSGVRSVEPQPQHPNGWPDASPARGACASRLVAEGARRAKVGRLGEL